MASITFKTKPETIYNMDDSPAYELVRVPKIGRKHCDMSAFRKHPKIGPYANSDMFPGILKRELGKMGIRMPGELRLDRLPEGVTVDSSGFLVRVTIEIA